MERRRNNRYDASRRHDCYEEFEGKKDFLIYVEFSPHDAETQPMFWNETSATMPFVAVQTDSLSRWSGTMRMTVADLMCEMPVTVGPECTTDEALEAFYEHETPELYVVDESGCLLGVLPDYELLKAQLSGEAKGACVEQLMSTSVPVCKLTSDAAAVARAFRDSQCNRMPVVSAGRVVGVVTRADVLRLMAVLRRIDVQSAPTKSEPKRPKHLDAAKAKVGTTRTSRAKTVSRKAASSRSRSKSAARSAR